MKKFCATLLAMVLIFTAFPFGVFDFKVNAEAEDYYSYTVENGEATITDVSTQISGDVTIPQTLGGYCVKAIGSGAFEGCTNITSVSIPNGVTSIKSNAFDNCSIESITIPSSVTNIESTAVYDCDSFEKIYITDIVSWCNIIFDRNAFPSGFNLYLNGERLTDLVIPNTVTNIGDYAFYNCKSLETITIANSVISIGRNIFSGCSNLKKIKFPFVGEKADGTGYTNFGYIFGALSASSNNRYVPSKIEEVVITAPCKTIYANAFYYCNNIKRIILPEGLETIEDSAFYKCRNIESINIPSSVTYIGESAFDNYGNLKNIYYGGSESNKTKLSIKDGNRLLYNATWYYNSCMGIDGHEYIGECCKTCIACGNQIIEHKYIPSRECNKTCSLCNAQGVEHKYYNICDEKCYSCGETRNANHIYSFYCDVSCNACGKYRSTMHTYFNKCDTTCDICGYERNIIHTYTNACDTACNICGAKRMVSPHTRKIFITPATTSKDGKAVKKCTICGSISSQRTIKKIKSFTLSTSTYLYNGKVRKPGITIKDSAGNKIASKFYTVTYPTGRKNVGQYKITIKFKGDYSGSKNLYFTIVPPKAAVSKLAAGKKSFTVNLTKKSTQVTGYQIQYSTNKSFTNPNRKTIGSYKITKCTLKNLKAKKTYYVRVRTYKTVSGKHYYSPWSAYKTVKTK